MEFELTGAMPVSCAGVGVDVCRRFRGNVCVLWLGLLLQPELVNQQVADNQDENADDG